LERAFEIAQAAVVRLTPDDQARLNELLWMDSTPEAEKELVGQARPNVRFEADLAFGRLPSRTILVEIGTQRQASDITGRHTIQLDSSSERRNDLAERLAQAGALLIEPGRNGCPPATSNR
jgi:predicted nucleotide-binding protein